MQIRVIILLSLLFAVVSYPQENRIIRQDSLRQSEARLKSAIGDSANVLRGELHANADSTRFRIFSNLKYVDKATTQNITGQKNFLGTIPIKLNADTSLRLGGLISGIPIGLWKQMLAPNYDQYFHSLVLPTDTANSGGFGMYSSMDGDWDTTTSREFSNYVIAYNPLRKGNKSWMATGMESEYEVPGQGNYYEWWYQFENRAAANPDYWLRPFSVSVIVPYDGDVDSISVESGLASNKFVIGAPEEEIARPGFYTTTYLLEFLMGRNIVNTLTIADTFQIRYTMNNTDWLVQELNPNGGGGTSLARIDELNNLYLYPDNGLEYGRFIRLGATIIGKTDSACVIIGNHTKDVNALSILSGDGYNGGSLYFKKDDALFGLIDYAGTKPSELSEAAVSNSRANLFLGGNIGVGTKTFGGSTNSIAISEAGTIPTTTAGQVSLYTEGGVLKVIDATGIINTLGAGDIIGNVNGLGSALVFTPSTEDFLYASTSRFTVTDSNLIYNAGGVEDLFDNIDATFGIIAENDTAKITIDFMSKGELPDSLIYPGGYIIQSFYVNSIPDSMMIRTYSRGGVWDTLTYSNISSFSGSGYGIYKFEVPYSPNWVTKLEFNYYSGADTCAPANIYYFLERETPSKSIVDKHSNNIFYNKLSWKNFNNTETAYIDSNGNAAFNNIISVPDTTGITDGYVTKYSGGNVVWAVENGLVEGDTILGTSATLDSIITDYWAGTFDATRFNDLFDVDIDNPTNGYYVTYNSGEGGNYVLTAPPSGTVTAAQISAINFMWAYLALDTLGVDPEFVSVIDQTVSTVITSTARSIDSSSCNVGRIKPITSSEYRYATEGAGWSSWLTTESYVKDLARVQVRDTSSASYNTTSLFRFQVAGIVDTFSVTTADGGAGYTTDSLKYYWLYSDLTNGTVTAGSTNDWVDKVASKEFTGVDSDPNKSSTGVLFDSNDDIYATTGFAFTNNVSMEVVVYIPDSTVSSGICGIKSGDYSFGLTMRDKLNAYATPDDGATSYFTDYDCKYAIGDTVHIVTTWSGSAIPKIYVNRTELTGERTNDGGVGATQSVILGYVNGSFPNGVIKLFRVYHKVLTSGEVTTNYNSCVSDGLLQ